MHSYLRFKHLTPKMCIKGTDSFYKAIAIAVYNDIDLHMFLRKSLTESMLESSSYSRDLRRSIQQNRVNSVWTPELADIIPKAITEYLPIRVEIYSNNTKTIRSYGDSYNSSVRLLEMDNQYDLLMKK